MRSQALRPLQPEIISTLSEKSRYFFIFSERLYLPENLRFKA